MNSTLCIGIDCNKLYHVEDSDTLLLYRCSDCRNNTPFVDGDHLRRLVAIKAMEGQDGLNVKQYERITLDRYPKLDSHITSMMKRPILTSLKRSILGNVPSR